MRKIAEDFALSTRFVSAMQAAQASLLVSSMTIYEFALLSDTRHSQSVDALLEQLFRHLYFIQCEPFTVIMNEDAIINGVSSDPPHADAELLKQTIILARQQQGPLQLTSLFSRHSTRLRPVLTEFTENVQKAFEILRTRVAADPALRRNADTALEQIGDRKTATRALLTALIKPLHDDRLPSENDTVDLMHAVVPGAYADFVVLDGKWASALTQAEQRIRRVGYNAPIAASMSLRGDGINDFIRALESRKAAACTGGV